MGWLEDFAKATIYDYRSTDDEVLSETLDTLSTLSGVDLKGAPGESFKFDLKTFYYAGFQPKKLGITTRVIFEKNGRKGIRIKSGDGKQVVRSMSRENLLKGKGVTITGDRRDFRGDKTGKKSYEIESVLTKSAKEASDKIKEKGLYNKIKYLRHQMGQNTDGRKK